MGTRISTLCVKEAKDKRTTRPHQLPIYATSSFELDSVEEGMEIFRDPTKGHLYGRFGNPTIDAVADKIASLEVHDTDIDNAWGLMTSSGLSAITTLLLSELKAGDKIMTQGNLYGGTTELIKNRLPNYGIDVVFTDLLDIEKTKEDLSKDRSIKLIYFETPSNPALDCIDIKAITKLAKENGLLTAVDNSFCSPVIQQPMKYGVDYVIHSTTKYINGHGNGISGIVIGLGKDNYKKVWSTMKLIGTNCNPFDAWLVNNGMKTLSLRMERHSANGLALSEYLSTHSQVKSVNYLGLRHHRFHKLARRQMNGYGGMMCFEVAGEFDASVRFMNALDIGALAPTMGDVDTLIMHPASMSHLNIERDIRLRNGITDSLIRVNVGIEDIEDLKEGFDTALSKI